MEEKTHLSGINLFFLFHRGAALHSPEIVAVRRMLRPMPEKNRTLWPEV